ncbi:hypothetical protein CERSUDRAFT_115426 [Gelatoporia subvermispora B]|uniref:DUF6534 domain-containing protein n=1 Tax=Ceriporiopsis subvermispora (strain B) TaxID=914234 RepID=M2PJP6_CERS8|nr:hypothetical protein CERSUDRAFT_115426 [Gelatoporia subvermispora B]
MASDHATIQNTLGAFLIGVIIAAGLWGITIVQTHRYLRESDNDPLAIKATVIFLWILKTLHQLLLVHGIYSYAIIDYGNPQALLIPTWSLLAAPVIAVTMDAIIRGLFCLRVWKLGHNWYMVAPIMAFSLIEFVGSVVWGGLAGHIDNFDKFGKISAAFYIPTCAAICADILIASSQLLMLSNLRTGFKRTDNILRTLMLYVINTGLLTTVMTTLCLILFAAMPDTLVYAAVFHNLSGLLFNALLATYNARPELRTFRDSNGDVPSVGNRSHTPAPIGRSLMFVNEPSRTPDDGSERPPIHITVMRDIKMDPAPMRGILKRSSSFE